MYTVPEAATILMKAGAMIVAENFTQSESVKFQINLMRLQMALEEIFTDMAMN